MSQRCSWAITCLSRAAARRRRRPNEPEGPPPEVATSGPVDVRRADLQEGAACIERTAGNSVFGWPTVTAPGTVAAVKSYQPSNLAQFNHFRRGD